ncbi:MAG TPA: ATP phosphoribosyltransferase, partial [Flavobacterium sp.]|nr:ATP phosphoribosyltransferase [Flavobacterium sp.]
VDAAIVGSNLLVEKAKNIEVVENLGFSKCKVSVAVPKSFEYQSIKDLNNL